MYKILRNRKDKHSKDAVFYDVCNANGQFLNDQSKENVELFEKIMANLPTLVFEDEYENLLDEKSYLSPSAGIVSDLNAGKYSIEKPHEFIDVVIREEYGSDGLRLLNDLYSMGMEMEVDELLLNMLYQGNLDFEEYEGDPIFNFDTEGIIFTDEKGFKYVIVKKE